MAERYEFVDKNDPKKVATCSALELFILFPISQESEEVLNSGEIGEKQRPISKNIHFSNSKRLNKNNRRGVLRQIKCISLYFNEKN